MRQVGILAAAGLYGLNFNKTRMAIDHLNAKKVARGCIFSIIYDSRIIVFLKIKNCSHQRIRKRSGDY